MSFLEEFHANLDSLPVILRKKYTLLRDLDKSLQGYRDFRLVTNQFNAVYVAKSEYTQNREVGMPRLWWKLLGLAGNNANKHWSVDIKRQNEQRCEQEIEDIKRGVRSGNITPDTSAIRFSDEALDEQKHSIRVADEKVALAVQAYDLVDTNIQQLDQYLKKFDEEIRRERENAAITGVPASGPEGNTKSGRGNESGTGRGGRKNTTLPSHARLNQNAALLQAPTKKCDPGTQLRPLQPAVMPHTHTRLTAHRTQPVATTHGDDEHSANGGDEHGANDGDDPHAVNIAIQLNGNVAACKKTPPNVVEELKKYMATKKSGTTYNTSGSGNMTNIRDFEFGEPIGCDGSEEDEFVDSCNAAASAKTKCGTKKGPMDKFCLSFNLIKLKSFENMVAAIGQYGPHLPIPSYHDIRVPLLKKEVEYTENLMKGYREQWVKYVCTIMSDAWTDRKQRCIINFLINSQAGTMFLKSVDGSDFVKTGENLFELLDAIVEEVGEANVVQVVTNNGSNYVLAGKLLEEKRKHIYWTPCAAHCIDLMLEDIGKLSLIRKTIRRAINLVGFIYAHSSTLSLLRNFTNKRELVRRAITRFVTSYLILERLHKEKTNIRKMFTSDEWTLNKLSKEPKGKEAAKVVLMPSFWNSVVYTLKVMTPLVKVLCLVDGEKKPAMGYIYETMDKAKETIIKSFNNNESKYKDVFAIIDKRWNCQLHRPLHAAVHFLNLEFFYDNTDLEFDFEVTNGLFKCIKKLIPQFDVQQKILTELHLYKIDAEHFGSNFLMAQRKTHSPTYWWRMFGSQTPNLQKLAIKILSLTCSASGCEKNWSVFEQQRYNARDEIDPISLNDIDVCNEWLVGEMDQDDDNDAENDLVFEDDDALNWATVYQASGVGEYFENIDLESEEEEIMVNFEASDGEEGEGDAPLPYDNNEDDYVGIGEDD
ncbi:PHD finger protein ING1 isoform B [Glycine soja]|uniref:PHD finger protein ING1 isoform B n=1 Tax=Glycine soja TaxID=3848 RepID=A0A445F244_GLYSO|nr:PHD finger protein ING1 isoform B [Glycine soja]